MTCARRFSSDALVNRMPGCLKPCGDVYSVICTTLLVMIGSPVSALASCRAAMNSSSAVSPCVTFFSMRIPLVDGREGSDDTSHCGSNCFGTDIDIMNSYDLSRAERCESPGCRV